MSFLLDTNAVSEPKRQSPNRGFMSWLQNEDSGALATSALVVGELRRGALKLGVGRRRSGIEAWLGQVLIEFGERVLPVDVGVASVWAEVALRYRGAGLIVGAIDELIAATAMAHELTLVTRNTRHFQVSGCRLLCPWSD